MSSQNDKDLKKYLKKLDDINRKIKIAEDLIFIDDYTGEILKTIIRPELTLHSYNYLLKKLDILYKIKNDLEIKCMK